MHFAGVIVSYLMIVNDRVWACTWLGSA